MPVSRFIIQLNITLIPGQMSNYKKITDLPAYTPEDHEMVHIATIDPVGVTRRIHIRDYTYDTEEKAIAKIKEIFANGHLPFILPYDNR